MEAERNWGSKTPCCGPRRSWQSKTRRHWSWLPCTGSYSPFCIALWRARLTSTKPRNCSERGCLVKRSEPISKSGEIGSGCLMTNIHLDRFPVSSQKNGRHGQSLLLSIMQIMQRSCLIIWMSQTLCPFHCQPSRAGCSRPILSTSRLQRASLSSLWTHLPPELFSSLFWGPLSTRRCVCVLSPRPNTLLRAIRLYGKKLQNL